MVNRFLGDCGNARTAVALPAHVFFACAWGYALGRAKRIKRPGPIFNKRATFVIGTDRRVLAAISSEMNMDGHADEALDVLRAGTG